MKGEKMNRFSELDRAVIEVIESFKDREEEDQPTNDCLPVSTELVGGEEDD